MNGGLILLRLFKSETGYNSRGPHFRDGRVPAAYAAAAGGHMYSIFLFRHGIRW